MVLREYLHLSRWYILNNRPRERKWHKNGSHFSSTLKILGLLRCNDTNTPLLVGAFYHENNVSSQLSLFKIVTKFLDECWWIFRWLTLLRVHWMACSKCQSNWRTSILFLVGLYFCKHSKLFGVHENVMHFCKENEKGAMPAVRKYRQ